MNFEHRFLLQALNPSLFEPLNPEPLNPEPGTFNMQNMTYALEERIGETTLFFVRKQEMKLLMGWVDMIPKKASQSRALLGRRKSGKTAIMQRLFNTLWNKNGAVVPFYIEVVDYERP